MRGTREARGHASKSLAQANVAGGGLRLCRVSGPPRPPTSWTLQQGRYHKGDSTVDSGGPWIMCPSDPTRSMVLEPETRSVDQSRAGTAVSITRNMAAPAPEKVFFPRGGTQGRKADSPPRLFIPFFVRT